MTLIIEAKELWRVYPSKTNAEGIPALRGVNLGVQPGTFVALKGRSGSGKTTLLKHIAQILASDRRVRRVYDAPARIPAGTCRAVCGTRP